MIRHSETMRAASRLLLSHPIVCLLAALAAVVVVLGVLGPIKVVHAADVAVEGENFANKPAGTVVVNDTTLYSGGQALKFTSDVSASTNVNCTAVCDVELMARGGQSGGSPTFSVNGAPAQAITNSGAPVAYTFDVNLPAGGATVSVTAGNAGTGHNAFLDVATFPASDGGGGTTTPNPNLLTANASSFETDLTGLWSYYDTLGSRDTTEAKFGSASAKMEITSAMTTDAHGWHGMIAGADAGGSSTVNANSTVVGSAYVKAPAGKTIMAVLRASTPTGSYIGETSPSLFTADGTWQRITTPASTWNQNFQPGIEVVVAQSEGAFAFNVDGLKVEQGSTVTDWNLGIGGGGAPAQCADGLDNDRDGKIDYLNEPGLNDPGCSSSTDNDETDPAATPLPPGFTQSRVVSGLTDPTDMEFAPDGRLFVAEQAGRVRIAKPDGTLATFLNISTKVNSSGERGLQALTFDPGFSTNRYVYLHYTKKATSTTPVHNRIVRVTANADSTKVVSGSETLILQLNNQSTDHHMGGAIDFGTDGKLYIATGDNQTPTNVSQNLANLFGKMLRINKDGTIPTDNPFYTTTSGNNRAIWALGLRNPFKFAVQPGKGTIFINDVGEKAWEEINEGSAGANYGWPVHEGVANDPQYVDPVFALAYGQDGACSITGGAFYNPETLQFPSGYVGDYFFADFCGGWIRSRSFDPSTGEASISDFAKEIVRPVDLEVSKGGELYYLSRGNSSTPGSASKIRHSGGNP
jgi:glucose/arabinose dehydrogenase